MTLHVSMMERVTRPNTVQNTTVETVLDAIKTGRWRGPVEKIRKVYSDTLAATGDVEAAGDSIRARKAATLPAICFAGTFARRADDALIQHSGLMVTDFDHQGAALETTKAVLANDPHVLAVFVSPSGDGLKAVVRVKAIDAETHRRCFFAAQQYFRDEYGLNLDPSGKDVSRACFVSFDPELVARDDATPFEPLPNLRPELEDKEVTALWSELSAAPEAKTETPPDADTVASALRAINPACEYSTWLEVGMALHSWDAKKGFDLFTAWSKLAPSRTPKPGEPTLADKWASFKGAGTTIATLFHHAKETGWTFPNLDKTNSETGTAELEAKYGPPFFYRETENGKVYEGLNEAHWAALHASQNVELWEPAERMFYRYDDRTGLYADITADTVKQEMSEAILARGRAVKLMGLIKDRSDRKLAAIVSQLKGIVEKREAFKKTDSYIHLANGVLIFRDGESALTPFSPDYRSRNQAPIAYDPKATCDRFLNELVLPAVHPEDVAIIQKYLGLCLLGRNIIQRFLILDGEAGRGKSQLAIVMQLLVGLTNCTQLRTEHLHERFELYRFLRKTLLVGVDAPADFLSTKGATVIKALVGGDIMDAEQKNGTGCFPMEGTYCIVMTSNSRLRVRLEGDMGAWRRRLLIVRYEAPAPVKKIPDFGKHLVETEGSGILNWALAGLSALLHDVETIGDISLTVRQTGMVDSLLAESDSLRQFLKDRATKSEDGDLTVNEIVQAYAEYCPMKGWSPLPITVIQRQVEGLMLELFQTTKVHDIDRAGKSQKGFRHVTFK